LVVAYTPPEVAPESEAKASSNPSDLQEGSSYMDEEIREEVFDLMIGEDGT